MAVSERAGLALARAVERAAVANAARADAARKAAEDMAAVKAADAAAHAEVLAARDE